MIKWKFNLLERFNEDNKISSNMEKFVVVSF